MKFITRTRKPVEINLAPLIDVVFLLLIFFMVSTTFSKEVSLLVDLPESGSQTTLSGEGKLTIVITKESNYILDQKLLSSDEVKKLSLVIKNIADKSDSSNLVIIADALAPHQSVVKAIDAARETGLARVSIRTSAFGPENHK